MLEHTNGGPAFERGDKVRIIAGPYRGFEGLVDQATPERERLRVIVPVNGRPARVELAYAEVRPL